MQNYSFGQISKSFPFILSFALLCTPLILSAHAVVSPFQAPTQTYQDFSLSVPTEKDIPTVGIRLVLPAQLPKATPFVKPGWKISVTKEGDVVTQIEWSGGSVPPGQKDIFQFTSVTPKENETLVWKVYQTYADGSVVAWDQEPGEHGSEHAEKNPYSTTEVRSDVLPLGLPAEKGKSDRGSTQAFAIVALALSLVALSVAFKKR